jgi:hypothetical protein
VSTCLNRIGTDHATSGNDGTPAVISDAEQTDRRAANKADAYMRNHGIRTALLTAVREKYPAGSAVLLTVVLQDDPWGPELTVGLDGDNGVLRYAGDDHPAGVYSRNSTPTNQHPVVYYFVTADSEFPPDAEVALTTVEAAMIEYMTTAGKRPTAVDAQGHGDMTERP